ncbi:MAG: hypothetical protein K2K09_01780, partial [Lachnospiraceae bacterium]|nr:hypothetical protein [Lachnospiraceae bacterium]
MVNNTESQDKFETIGTKLDNPVTGVHDVYFVFRGTGYDVASWKFESNMEYVSPYDAITGITSGDNEIEDYEIKYENGVYNIYITGENEEPGCQFDVSTVNGKTPIIIYNEFTGYTKRMGTVYVDMGNYEYTYYMYYWCSANPKPTPTPKPATPAPPTPTPRPTPTPEPTSPPEMLDHYSAPYTLVFGSDTVKTQGSSSYTLNDDGTVTIQVSGQYSGIAFVLPKDLEENNFDTVTVTYKDARDVGDGYGCGLWRTGEDKDSEDVVAWNKIFKEASSGEYKASIAGRDSTNAWYVNKCLFFNNTNNDALSAAPATVTITSVVFSHSKYGESVETPKPTATPKPFEDIVINPSDFGNSDFVITDKGNSSEDVSVDSSSDGYSTVTIPAFAGIIIKNPSKNVNKYKYVQITYSCDNSVDTYLFDDKFTDGKGQTPSGQHEVDKLVPSSAYNTVTYSA